MPKWYSRDLVEQLLRKMKYITIAVLTSLLSFACSNGAVSNTPKTTTPKRLTEAEALLKQTLVAHGGERYDHAHYQFTFRKKQYTFKNSDTGYTYSSESKKDGQLIVDRLDNGSITRKVDGLEIQLTSKEEGQYSESLNSVIYFATLPHKLQDPAVNIEIVGETIIQSKKYDILQVTFDEKGGGKDHDDQFHYWINKADHTIDYLAYNYKTNKGGVRFRSAYNRRVVDGIIFQDYINYKAEIGTPLRDLPTLFENNELKELSRIETEDVSSK